MNENDPRLTAYALGELGAKERRELEQELAREPDFYGDIDEVTSLSRMLEESFDQAPLPLPSRQKPVQIPRGVTEMKPRSLWQTVTMTAVTTAACLAGAAYFLSGLVLKEAEQEPSFVSSDVSFSLLPSPDWSDGMIVRADRTVHVESISPQLATSAPERVLPSERNSDNFQPVAALASTDIPVVSGRESYPLVREYLNQGKEGQLPPAEIVKVEELINAFPYDQPRDLITGYISAGMRVVDCPWHSDRMLLGILLRNTSKIDQIEIKARLTVDDQAFESYRLLGYADPADPSQKVEQLPKILPPGESQFVLYELVCSDIAAVSTDLELASLKIRSRPQGRSWDDGLLICRGQSNRWQDESEDFRFASIMAGFGSALLEEDHKRQRRMAEVRRVADELVSSSARLTGSRREAVDLIYSATNATRQRP